MKKFSFAKIASLVLAFTMLLGALTVTVLATEEPTVEIVSNNVYYGEKYQLMYAVTAGATVSAKDSKGNAIKVVSFEKDPTRTINDVEYDVYVLAEGVAAQAIDEVITFTAEYKGVTATSNYSVLQYVYERLNVKNLAQGDEKIMLEALLTFASAANKVIDKDDTSFSDYKYVTVVGGTLDGDNVAGMFLPNATPFANIVATPDYDTSAYNVEWSVSVDGAEAVRYDNDEIKTLAITGNTVVTRELVESECQHVWSEATCTELATCSKCGATTGELLEHAWTDATCEAPKTCDNCGATEGEVADHADNDGDLACDTCGTKLVDKVTITFDSTDKCISSSATQQVWTENGIVFTNDKAAATNNVLVSNPVRCYKGSTITITYPGMKQIVIACTGSDYAGISATTAGKITKDGTTFTITFDNPVDSVTLTCGDSQTRISKLDVVATVCNHENTYEVKEVPATCTKTGTTAGVMCSDCGRVVSGVEEIEMADHTEVEIPAVEATCGEAGSTAGAKCSVCGTVTVPTTNVPATGEHVDGDGNGSCDVCKHEMGTPDTPTYVDKTYSYTFSSKVFTANATNALNGVNWTASGDGGYWGSDGTKGQQFGSSSKPYKSLTLVSDEFTNVKEIKINTSGASSINAKLVVLVDGVEVGSVSLTASATEYTFTLNEALTGEISFSYSQTSSKAIYIKSINVSYQEAE